MTAPLCRICGHPQDEHQVYAPDGPCAVHAGPGLCVCDLFLGTP